ncbi:hypothetical protein PoB_000703600 [Plakobranchus ocellatus]|uniref:Uncharacterized protein n=1 Tax=Plakobranchus ocellatus TaxID=259542 RepID=A0AAV3YDQ6_9GAST|nr:hypothetical protein PoB_000703600 [Plakobranchus ocellatus]
MEYFGFASGTSKTGPAFPYMPESVLNGYPNTLMDHPAVPAAVNFLNMQTPNAKNIVAVVRTWADKSFELLEKPSVQAVGIGLSASIFVYGVWRISKRRNKSVVMCKKDSFRNFESDPCFKETFLFEGEHVIGASDGDGTDLGTGITQRQLVDTRSKLNDLRYQLNQLEGEKDMLSAEVSMRKKIVAQLQGEIHVERDKRQQAELKMEMMEWENSHLRRLRKDVAEKEGKIDMLEANLKEKAILHDKLFQENVILPKNVAAARAKEYEILHAKVQKYEMEAVMKRNSEAPYKPNRRESVTSAVDRNPYDTAQRAPQRHKFSDKGSSESFVPSDWDKSPSSTISTARSQPYASNITSGTETLLFSTMNLSNSKKTFKEKIPDTGCENNDSMRHLEELVGHENWNEVEIRAQNPKFIHRYEVDKSDNIKKLNRNYLSTESKAQSEYSSQCPPSVENDPGVMGSIRSFFSGLTQSGSESGLLITPGSPAQLVDVLPSQSRLWDKSSDDKANNCCQDDEERDCICCPSVSDGHSSLFMSASCGSDTSDDDNRNVSQGFNQSSSQAGSFKREVSPDDLKRIRSPCKKAQKGITYTKTKRALKEFESAKTALSTDIQTSKLVTPSWKVTFNKQEANCKKLPLSEESSLNEKTISDEHKETYHSSRTRQRCRQRRSRSKLTVVTSNTSKNAYSPLATRTFEKALVSEKLLEKKCRPLAPPKTSEGDKGLTTSSMDLKSPIYPMNSLNARKKSFISKREKDVNKNSTEFTDTDSEESWIVIIPSK